MTEVYVLKAALFQIGNNRIFGRFYTLFFDWHLDGLSDRNNNFSLLRSLFIGDY